MSKGAKDKNIKTLLGLVDSRSKTGIMARGKNVYRGGSNHAHSGGGKQFGRPKITKGAIARRLGRY